MSVKQIKIIRLDDEHDCETCGSSWATGYLVEFDGETVMEFEPFAYCYDSASFELDFIYAQILQKLGYAVVVE